MSSATIGRLFVALDGDTKSLNSALQEAVNTAKAAGVDVNKAGESFITSFQNALDPTIKLTEKITLLEAAGKSEADILAVMKDNIIKSGDAATANGQTMSALTQKYYDMAKATNPAEDKSAGSALNKLGAAMTDFANNPIGTIKTALGGFLESMGPVAVAIGGIATAAIGAGVAVFNFASEAANQHEKLTNLSTQTGLTVTELQALKQIQSELGLDGLNLSTTLGKINQELGDTKPNEFKTAMEKLGISIKDADGNTKSAITALDDIRTKLVAVQDPTEKAQLAQQLFGGRLRELIPLLLNSETGLQDMITEMVNAGVTTDDLTNQKLAAFDSILDQTSRTTTALKTSLIELVMWGISPLTEAIGEAQGYKSAKAYNDQLASMGVKLDNSGLSATDFTTKMGTLKVSVDHTKESFSGYNDKFTVATDSAGNYITKVKNELTPEQEKLKTAWENSIAPLTALSTEFTSLKTVGADVNTFVIAHKDAIIDSATKQFELKGKITDTDAELLEMAIKLQKAETDTKALNAAAKQAAIDQAALEAAFASTSEFIDTSLSASLAKATADLAGVKPKDPLADFFPTTEELGKIETRIETSSTNIKNTLNSVGTAFGTAMGNAVDDISAALADAIIEWKNPAGSIMNAIKDMGKNMLTALTDAFVSPLNTALTNIASGVGNWLAGLVTGQGTFSLSSLGRSLLGGGAGLAGLFSGGTAAAGTAAAASGISLDAALAGGAGSGFWGTLGAFATNPITLGVAGGAALGYLGYRLAKGQSTWGAGAKEVARDMGGVEVGSDAFKDFLTAMGTDPNEMWNYRKDTMFAPQFLTYAYAAAVEQGKTGSFLSSLSNITTAMGTGNFRSQFEDYIKTGNATGLNQSYMDLFGRDVGFVNQVGGDLSRFLLPGTNVNGVPNNITVNINGGTFVGDDLDQVIAESVDRVFGRGGYTDIANARPIPGLG